LEKYEAKVVFTYFGNLYISLFSIPILQIAIQTVPILYTFEEKNDDNLRFYKEIQRDVQQQNVAPTYQFS
jgi:hypothetical protein